MLVSPTGIHLITGRRKEFKPTKAARSSSRLESGSMSTAKGGSGKQTSFNDWGQGLFDSSFFESLEREDGEEGSGPERRDTQLRDLDDLDFGEINPAMYSRCVEVGSQDILVIGSQESCEETLQAKQQREGMKYCQDTDRASILAQQSSFQGIQMTGDQGAQAIHETTIEEQPLSQEDGGVVCAQPYTESGQGDPAEQEGVDLNQELQDGLQGLVDLKKVQEHCSALAQLTTHLIKNSLNSNNCPYRTERLIEMRDHVTAIMSCAEEAANEPYDCTRGNQKKKPGRSSSSPVAPVLWDGDLSEVVPDAVHDETRTLDMEFMPGSIGLRCGAYKRPIATIEDPGADQLSGKRRKLCGNPRCATHRHRIPVRTDALKVCDWIENKATADMLSQIWLYIEGTPDIKLTGAEIHQRLLWQTPLDLEMASVLIRLLRELEEETIFRRPNCQGRHYVDPAWGVMVANGTICPEASFEHFMYPAPPYDIKSCSIVLTLVCVSSNWSCYAFDFTSNVISIMDPMVRHPVEEATVKEHTTICHKLLAEVLYCMRRATGNMYMGHGKWTPKMMMAGGRKPIALNSGIIALNCMRWYNGNSVCDPPRDGQTTQTRKDLTFQLLTMRSNKAKPAISEMVDRAVRSASKCKRKHEPESSQVASSGADNEDCAHTSGERDAPSA